MTHSSEVAVIFTPLGRDAAVASTILAEAGMAAMTARALPAFVAALRAGAGFAIVTEEALRDGDLRDLAAFIADQAEWSDFPIILLTDRGGGRERNPAAGRMIEALGNVTFLERPFHPTTLVSLCRSALRARRRQYQARASLETIRQGQARLRQALAAGSLGAWALETPSLSLRVSAQGKAQHGRGPDDAFGWRELIAAIHPDDRPRVREHMLATLGASGDYDVEYRCLWPDGGEHWLHVRGGPDPAAATDNNGGRRFSGVSLDITERKQAEADLQRSEERFRAAVQAVGGVVWTNSADGRMVGDQPGWAALTGQTQAEYEGFGWSGAVHPDDRAPTVEAWNAAVAGRRPFVFEHRVRRRDGRWRSFAIRAIPALEPDGTIREWVGIHTDISAQKAAQRELASLAATLEDRVAAATAELKASQARLRSIFESSYQYQGVLTPAGILVDANATSLAGIGAQLDEVVGRPFWEMPWFTATPGLPELIREATARVAAGETVRQEMTARLPGGWRTFDFSMRAMRDETGRTVALLPEAMDITERRSAEENLLQSQKLETIGQLTGGVAHDFNNLLTPIVGSIDLLRRKLAGDERAQMMAAAGLQSAERAKVLVNRLLAFARRQALEPRPVDVAALVDGMRDLVERSIGPTIAVEVDAAGDLPAAQVDPNQLELSILNLAVNARDAMPSGGRLTIAVGLDAVGEPNGAGLAPGRYVRLSVTDTGVGMDAATAKRAIEPFYTTKGVGEGTGLGLSMVHGLMAQLGGGMAIDSEVGLGTRVTLWLPALEVRAAAPAPYAGAPVIKPTVRARILLVDDEALVRFATADMLRDAGYEVVEAASAAEARERVRAGLAPDVLVTDQLMPGGRGTDLASGLCEALPDLKVLVATGYADMPDIRYPRIAKPFGAAELVERVRSLVEVA